MIEHERLHIRPARPDDREPVFAMVATVWGGRDYVPSVWDEWLLDQSGPLLVGELAGRPVALAKLSELAPGEDWFHGLRIDPELRGRGLGRAMLRRCVELSRGRGAHTLRYLTDRDNPTMHRMGEQSGFRLAYAPHWYEAQRSSAEGDRAQGGEAQHGNVHGAIWRSAQGPQGPPAPGPASPELSRLGLEDLAALLGDLGRSALLALTGGMYSYAWRVFDLKEAALRQHLGRGEVLALPGRAAWAIVVPNDEGGVWLAHLEGGGAALAQLCGALLAAPALASGEYIRALLPPQAPAIPALLAAGFCAPDDVMHLYELRHVRD